MTDSQNDGWETVTDPHEAEAAKMSGADKGIVRIKGDAYKSTLSPERLAVAQAIVDNRYPVPTGSAMRSPQVYQAFQDASLIDPSIDAANYGARVKAHNDLAGSTPNSAGGQLAAFERMLLHGAEVLHKGQELHNFHSGILAPANTLLSIGRTVVQDDGQAGFNKAVGNYSPESQKAIAGFGGTGDEREERKGFFPASVTPEALVRGLQTDASQALDAGAAINDRYKRLLGKDIKDLLSPQAKKAYDTIMAGGYDKDGKPLHPAEGWTPISGSAGQQPPDGGALPPTGGADGSPGAPPPPGGPAPLAPDKLQISDGTSKAVDQSATQPIREEIARMINTGKSGNDIRAYIQSAGVNPTSVSGLDELVDWRSKNPGYKGGYDITIGPQNVAMSGGEALANDIAGSAPGAAVLGAANTALFGTLPKITAGIDAVTGRLGGDQRSVGDIYNGALAGANYKLGAARDAHPVASLVGDTAGFLTGDAALGYAAKAIPGAAALTGRIPMVGRELGKDAAFGALTGLGSSDKLSDVPGNVAGGAALTAVGGVLGRGLVKGAANLASPVVGGAAKRLTDAGVTLTPGQLLGASGGVFGKTVKVIEDKATSIPVLGDVINNTRRGGVEDFNRAALNDVLSPIGMELPKDVSVGHAAIAHAQESVSKAIENALQPIHAQLDNQITTDIGAVGRKVSNMGKDALTQFKGIVANDIQPFWPKNGVMTGEQLQAVKRGLDKEIASRSGAGVSPADRSLGERLSEMRDAVMDFAARADPANASAFSKANEAYSLLSRVENAAAKSKDGVFTPNQFRQAVTKRGHGTTTKNVARGTARMQELSTDASMVLPSAVPDSGTVGRALIATAPGAVLGGAAGYHEGGSGSALPGALIGAGLLSRPGAKAIQWGLAGSRGKPLNTLGALLRKNSATGGAVGAPLLLSRLTDQGN